jgi:hypothetical protein
MSYIEDNPLKFLSVKLPIWGAFLLGVIPVLLQQGMDTQIIPTQYHAVILSLILPALGYIGKKKYQPELHPELTILGFASIPSDAITFDEAFRRLIGHEGGYSNDKRDPGNWTSGRVGVGELKGTKFGLAANTYPTLDIKNITLEQAKKIYKTDWWDKLGGHGLHSAVVFQLWDFAINAGVSRAVKELQQAVGVNADGVIGPKTIAATNSMDLNDVLLTLTAERLKFYTSLSTFKEYGKGWTNRVADNLKYAAKDN